MALITAQVGITPPTFTAYIGDIDATGAPWDFVGAGEANGRTIVLTLTVDGVESTEKVTLHPDGTWTATAHLIVREQP